MHSTGPSEFLHPASHGQRPLPSAFPTLLQAAAVSHAISEINDRFGKNSVMQLGDRTFGEVSTTPSGALTLDLALGGGYPVGRVVEISGPEASGKTTLALHAMAQVQRRGGRVALIDAEHAFDPQFARRLGLDVSALYLCQPDSGEMALEVADSLIRSGGMDMVAVDSVAALVPRAELEGEIGQTQIGGQARLMSAALRKIAGNASRHACTIIFLNQIRLKVGVLFGNPETTSGGMALKYYASVRLEVRPRERIKAGDAETGIRIRARCTKNKVAPPYRTAEFDIMFGSGINAAGCVLDAAEKLGVVTRRGAYYYLGDERLGQGRDRALESLTETPEKIKCVGLGWPAALSARGRGGDEGVHRLNPPPPHPPKSPPAGWWRTACGPHWTAQARRAWPTYSATLRPRKGRSRRRRTSPCWSWKAGPEPDRSALRDAPGVGRAHLRVGEPGSHPGTAPSHLHSTASLPGLAHEHRGTMGCRRKRARARNLLSPASCIACPLSAWHALHPRPPGAAREGEWCFPDAPPPAGTAPVPQLCPSWDRQTLSLFPPPKTHTHTLLLLPAKPHSVNCSLHAMACPAGALKSQAAAAVGQAVVGGQAHDGHQRLEPSPQVFHQLMEPRVLRATWLGMVFT